MAQVGKPTQTEIDEGWPEGGGGGQGRGVTANGDRVSFWGDKNVLNLTVNAQLCKHTEPLNCTL